MRKVFISSVTGAQGQGIAQVFIKNGFSVSSLTREDRFYDDITTLKGEYSDTEKLLSLMTNTEAIILTLPLIFDRQEILSLTKNIIEGAKKSGVNKIIFNTSAPLGKDKTGYLAIDLKHEALQLLEESGLEIITLMPTIYLENICSPFLLPVIHEHKIIPYPIAKDNEFNWISYENLGRYCLAATERDNLAGQRILITNNDNISKQKLATMIGAKLGSDIQYVESTTDQFEESLQPVLGENIAREIANFYRGVSENFQDFITYSNRDFIDSVELQTTENWVSATTW